MVHDALTIGTDEDNHQVTAVISHVVRSGREQGYEEWLHGIAQAARQFKGHRGVSVIRPRDHAHPEYVAIVRFDHYNHLKQWMESDVRREWLGRLQPLIEKPEAVQTLTGLEIAAAALQDVFRDVAGGLHHAGDSQSLTSTAIVQTATTAQSVDHHRISRPLSYLSAHAPTNQAIPTLAIPKTLTSNLRSCLFPIIYLRVSTLCLTTLNHRVEISKSL
jgi:heme-degrading monooxygenase HmoA